MKLSIKIKLAILLAFVSTRMLASLDSCYIISSLEFSNIGMEFGKQITLTSSSFNLGESTVAIQSKQEEKFGHRSQLIEHFNCLYPFEQIDQFSFIHLHSFDLNDGSLLHIIDNLNQTYLLDELGNLIELTPCLDDNYCLSLQYCPPILFNLHDVIVTPLSESPLFSTPLYEIITEQVLVKEASNSLEIIPAEFENVTETYLYTYTSICPDYSLELELVTEQVLVKESYSILEIQPSQHETVTEQVLVKEGHTSYEIIEVDNIESIPVEYSPEHLDITWEILDGVCIEDIFDCTQLAIDTIPAEYIYLDNPTLWDCNDISNWNNSVLIQKKGPNIYGPRCFEKLVQPTTTIATQVPAQYQTIQHFRLQNKGEVPDTCIIKEYKTRAFELLASPATTISSSIPAEYGLISYEILLKDSEVLNQASLLDCSDTLSVKYLYAGGREEIKEVDCSYITSDSLQLAIINQLYSLEYLEDPNTVFGSKIFWEATIAFRNDYWFPDCIGNLDETFLKYLFSQ